MVLIGVIKESVAHAYFEVSRLSVNVIFQLFTPHPVVNVLSVDDSVLHQVLNNVNVMDDIKDQALYFRKQKKITLIAFRAW